MSTRSRTRTSSSTVDQPLLYCRSSPRLVNSTPSRPWAFESCHFERIENFMRNRVRVGEFNSSVIDFRLAELSRLINGTPDSTCSLAVGIVLAVGHQLSRAHTLAASRVRTPTLVAPRKDAFKVALRTTARAFCEVLSRRWLSQLQWPSNASSRMPTIRCCSGSGGRELR